ncbi:MAG: biotin--[acetyl-CoA-carboxylase] ligase [Candidatus Eisenbacteria bacterium]
MSAEPRFDRAAFEARLGTRRLGRFLMVRDEASSTNDLAWDLLAEGGPDGAAVIAETQLAGRGRAGRRWVMAPGRGLALSVALHLGCDRRQAGLVSMAAGLALAEALEGLGRVADLKWPNDLLLRGRKVSGILAESRRLPLTGDAVVVGIGVNVLERRDDFPPELHDQATSLSLEGLETTREAVAAAFLDAFEPRWDELQEGDRDRLLSAWSARSGGWGRAVVVRTPAGERRGVALRLDDDGALVIRDAGGGEVTVMAGDLAWDEAGARS